MKKILVLFVALMMMVMPAMADQPDYVNMKDDELQTIVDSARNELVKRQLEEDGKILLFEQDGISVYLTGEYETDWMGYILIKAIVINNTDKKYDIHPEDTTISVNGWDAAALTDLKAKPGQKKKGSIAFRPEDADIKTSDEIQDMVFYFSLRFEGGKWQHLGPYTVHVDNYIPY